MRADYTARVRTDSLAHLLEAAEPDQLRRLARLVLRLAAAMRDVRDPRVGDAGEPQDEPR
jgi:hypothetical protein